MVGVILLGHIRGSLFDFFLYILRAMVFEATRAGILKDSKDTTISPGEGGSQRCLADTGREYLHQVWQQESLRAT